MIDPGQRTRRITLLRPATTVNAAGEGVRAWQPAYRVWARVLQPRAVESIRNGIVAPGTTYAINVWWLPNLDTTWRIDLDGQTLEIASIVETEHRAEYDIVATLHPTP